MGCFVVFRLGRSSVMLSVLCDVDDLIVFPLSCSVLVLFFSYLSFMSLLFGFLLFYVVRSMRTWNEYMQKQEQEEEQQKRHTSSSCLSLSSFWTATHALIVKTLISCVPHLVQQQRLRFPRFQHANVMCFEILGYGCVCVCICVFVCACVHIYVCVWQQKGR